MWRVIEMATIEEVKTCDEVLKEVRHVKDELAKSFNYDIRQMLQDARAKQKKSGRIILHPLLRQDA
jgi:polyhydroxyalkanoate synthesis regulator phasin